MFYMLYNQIITLVRYLILLRGLFILSQIIFPYSKAQYFSIPHRFFFNRIYTEMNYDFKGLKIRRYK